MKPARRPLLGALAAAALLSFLLILDPPGGLLVLFPSSLVRSSPYAHRPKLLFLLAGQSNMAGRGALPTSRPQLPLPYHTHPRILRLSAARRWVAASPPLHADIDTHKTCGLGPAMPFAHRVLSSVSADSAPSSVSDPGAAVGDDPLVLGLVPCAVGGTRIWMWARGQPLYEAAVVRTRAAVADGGGTLGAVLWFQGESDTIEMDDARSYGGKMERLVADLRADLGLPNLLVIQVGLASGEGNYTDIVREAQKSINLPNVILVDAMGLPLRDDQLHLSTEAQLQLGDMLAQAYLEFNSSREPRL